MYSFSYVLLPLQASVVRLLAQRVVQPQEPHAGLLAQRLQHHGPHVQLHFTGPSLQKRRPAIRRFPGVAVVPVLRQLPRPAAAVEAMAAMAAGRRSGGAGEGRLAA
jgi:hypothetical protein